MAVPDSVWCSAGTLLDLKHTAAAYEEGKETEENQQRPAQQKKEKHRGLQSSWQA